MEAVGLLREGGVGTEAEGLGEGEAMAGELVQLLG